MCPQCRAEEYEKIYAEISALDMTLPREELVLTLQPVVSHLRQVNQMFADAGDDTHEARLEELIWRIERVTRFLQDEEAGVYDLRSEITGRFNYKPVFSTTIQHVNGVRFPWPVLASFGWRKYPLDEAPLLKEIAGHRTPAAVICTLIQYRSLKSLLPQETQFYVQDGRVLIHM